MSTTNVLLLVIAVGVWVMAAETVIFTAMKIRAWIRESRQAVLLARRIRAAQVEPAEDDVTL